MVWKTKKVVIQSKKTFLSNIGIVILTGFSLAGFLLNTIVHSPYFPNADWNYSADHCTRYLTLTTEMNGETIKVIEQMFSVCLI